MATRKPTVFLSHSFKDEGIVKRVAKEIRELDLDPWLYQQDIVPGDRIPGKLSTGLANASYFLLFWSRHSVQSRWVQSEVDVALFRWADEKSVLIVPMRLDDTELPELLRPISSMDFREGLESGLLQLRRFFGREGFGPDQPPRLLTRGAGCKDKLASLRDMDLRLLLKSRLALNDVREIWMDAFQSRLDDELPGVPLGVAIGEMLIKSTRHRVRGDLLQSICANRPDVEID